MSPGFQLVLGGGVCVWARRVPHGLRLSHVCPVTSEVWPLVSDLPVTVLGPGAWQCFLGGGGADLKDIFLAFPLLCELCIFPSLASGFVLDIFFLMWPFLVVGFIHLFMIFGYHTVFGKVFSTLHTFETAGLGSRGAEACDQRQDEPA